MKKTIKKLLSLLFVLMIVLSACAPTADTPKQDAVAAETAEAAEGVTAPPASDGTIGSHDPTQEERREEMQKADSEDAPMPYQSDPDTEQEGRREEVQKADEERWQEEAEAEATNQEPENEPEDEPGEGEWHEVDGVRFYTEHRLDDFLEPYPYVEGVYYLDLGKLLSAVFGDDITPRPLSNGYICDNDVGVITYSSSLSDNGTFGAGFVVERTLKMPAVTCNSGIECNVITLAEATIVVKEIGTDFSYDMAELLIYVLEQMEDNPRNNIGDELGLPSDDYVWYHMTH